VLSQIACDYEKPLKKIYEKQEQRQLKKLDFKKETNLQTGENKFQRQVELARNCVEIS
jgi:hypothetical protein